MWNSLPIHLLFSKSEHMIHRGEGGKSSALLQNSDVNSCYKLSIMDIWGAVSFAWKESMVP